MKMYPLGVGGAFTKSNFHNNYILQLNKTNLLIDAGTTLRNSITEANFSYTDIDFVYISHLHFDHVGGLEEMIMQRYWQFKNGQHSPQKTKIIVHENLLLPLKKLLCNGLENQDHTIEDFCSFITLSNGEVYKIEDYEFSLFDTTNAHVKGMPSSGFKLSWQEGNIVFTGDIKWMDQVNILNKIDINTVAIFQDISFTSNGVHASIQEVLNYYPTTLHGKLYGMHYNDNIEQFNDMLSQTNITLVKKHGVLEF
ncbi:MBL fold metallo-hydrolase [Lysinibacillus endophyticus]|uniref:MBL fold metallo-hydrolase n=1 Tax=Ureibacillus endophyticus TaxID=1978490 RepID=UPI00209D6B59|nr:MBL fold metallo-hydrolase [Lysinibacillus endophyticus]MCP1143193.1 MBL fold metallo-hydrolase [Lysinibacillus endophyticus]